MIRGFKKHIQQLLGIFQFNALSLQEFKHPQRDDIRKQPYRIQAISH